MLDHILLDVIGAIREALEAALLEQQAVEERFQVDVFLGDVSFETSYSLPGEQNPPRVRADFEPRVADLEPERLPLVVDRRVAGGSARAGDRGGVAPAAAGECARSGVVLAASGRQHTRDRRRAARAHRHDDRAGPRHRPRRPLSGDRGLLPGHLPDRGGRAGGPAEDRRPGRRRWPAGSPRASCASPTSTCRPFRPRTAKQAADLRRAAAASGLQEAARPRQLGERDLRPGTEVADHLASSERAEPARRAPRRARGQAETHAGREQVARPGLVDHLATWSAGTSTISSAVASSAPAGPQVTATVEARAAQLVDRLAQRGRAGRGATASASLANSTSIGPSASSLRCRVVAAHERGVGQPEGDESSRPRGSPRRAVRRAPWRRRRSST